MNILRHLYLNSVFRAPDDPVAPEPVAPEATSALASEASPEPQPELQPEPAPAPAPQPEPTPAAERTIPIKTFERVVAEVRGERRQERAAREAAEQRAADLQAIIDRLQAGGDPAAAAAAAARPAAPVAPTPGQRPADFDAAVKAQAAKDRLYEDTLVVRSAGEAKFPDFNQSLGILTAIGATNDDFVSDLLAVDKGAAHEIIDRLAKDPEKAASLVTMDSRRRIAELTRMADAIKPEAPKPAEPAKPAAPVVSRAPAPAPRMAPVAPAAEIDPRTPEGNEKMSDAQWEKWAKSQGVDGLLKRRA